MALAILLGVSHAAWAQVRWSRLSDGMGFSDVTRFLIAPRGDRVVYLDDAVADGEPELWSVPIGGGVPVRLGAEPLPTTANSFLLTPDGLRVVYIESHQDPPPGAL